MREEGIDSLLAKIEAGIFMREDVEALNNAIMGGANIPQDKIAKVVNQIAEYYGCSTEQIVVREQEIYWVKRGTRGGSNLWRC